MSLVPLDYLLTNSPFAEKNENLAEYKASFKVDDQTRKNYKGSMLPFERLGVDSILKENYLLEYAMKNPNEYVKTRNEYMKKVKDETDKEFVKLYNKFTTGDYVLPPREAKELAFEGARNYERLAITHLESLFPSKFEGSAYKRLLAEQQAKQSLEFGGIKTENKNEETIDI